MHTKFGKNTSIIQLEESIKSKIKKCKSRVYDLYLGKCTKFKEGKLKGRWGKISSIVCFDGVEGIIVCISPFSIKNGQVGKLMHDHEEALKGRVFSELDIFADYVSNDALTKRGI